MKSTIYKTTKICLSWAVAATLGFSACTADFEDLNTNPTGLKDSDLALANFFLDPQLSIYFNQTDGNWEYQLIQNLNADQYSGYLAVPTPYNGNNNNCLYFMDDGWNNTNFNYGMLHIMKPTQIILNAIQQGGTEESLTDFWAIAKILRVAGMQKVTDTYGPIPYTKAMQGGLAVEYDSQETIYKAFFTDLDDAITRLTAFIDKNGDLPDRLAFDRMCGQSHKQWLKFANTLRLRLAMRLVKIVPELAKQQAEAAVANKYGVLTSADKNVMVVADGIRNPLIVIVRDYNDCGISASFESIMSGYKDPRFVKMVLPVGWKKDSKGTVMDILDKDGKPTNSIGKIKGIRNGFPAPTGGEYKMYSIIRCDLSTTPYTKDYPLPIMRVAEAYFLRAEGALRGWNMGGSAKELYEAGIMQSFTDYGVTENYNAYINDDKSTAIDYVDPYSSEYNIKAVNDVTIKWDEAASNEVKLQRIITQKWIANFPEGAEGWSDFRRTGYPKQFPIVENRSNGIVPKGDFIKRLPFTLDEKNSNPTGVATGVQVLGGPDNIATRLWWDVNKANF